jgi:subtilisin family serine protease
MSCRLLGCFVTPALRPPAGVFCALLLFVPILLGQARVPELPYVPGRLLVRFKPATKAQAISAAHAKVRGKVSKRFGQLPGLEVVDLAPDMPLTRALAAYRSDPGVLYAEPDYILHVQAIPNDPDFSQLWGMSNINAPAAWSKSTGSSNVVVAVIDTGVDYTHEDLAANVWRNPGDCNSNGIDDDNSGYVDDCYGIDVVNRDSDPMDDNSHGTHVSGTIGAVGNNSIGVVGVNWDVKILACKFLGADGSGPSSGAIECLDYIAHLKSMGVPIVASNNSWGGPGISAIAPSASLKDAIRLNLEREILFVVAAGNGGWDKIGDDNDRAMGNAANTDLPNIISVAAINSSNSLTAFSNFGRHTVHIGAPGDNIRSTVPKALAPAGYANFRGTSMATPHVTGVAALLKAWNPALTWWEIRNLILTGGTPTAGLAKTIAKSRLSASGAMDCTDAVLLARFRPEMDVVGAAVGNAIPVSAYHLKCAAPNGDVVATVSTGETLTLKDDGIAPDVIAGDGLYAANYVPRAVGQYVITLPNAEVLTINVLQPYLFEKVSEPYRYIAGTNLDLDAAECAAVTPPFPLRFGGIAYDSVYISPHGSVSFGQPWCDPNAWPTPMPWPVNWVAPFMASLAPFKGSPKNAWYEISGTAPNREMVVEWRDLPMFPMQQAPTIQETETVAFQLVFFEGQDDIVFAYQDTVFGGVSAWYDHGRDAAVGIQVAGTVGTQYNEWGQDAVFDGDAIRWTPTSGPVISYVDPSLRAPAWPSQTINVVGNTFRSDSFVRIAKAGVVTPLATTFRSETKLEASLPREVVSVPGSYYITVSNPAPSGELVSNPRLFMSMYPPPVIDRVEPASRAAGSGQFTLHVFGSGYVGDLATIWWNGWARPTTVVSANELSVSINEWDVQQPGTVKLTLGQEAWAADEELYSISGYALKAAQPAAQTVKAGGVANYNLTIEPTGNYDAPITFQCRGNPATTACAFTPATVTPGSTAAPVQLKVTTTGVTSASLGGIQPGLSVWLGAFLLFPTVGLLFGGRSSRRRAAVLLVLVLGCVATLPSCGGSGSGGGSPAPKPGTTPGTYAIMIIGTSGTYSSSTTVSVTITQP